MLTTQEAANYCGMKLSTFRYHLYVTKAIAPTKKKVGEWVGSRLLFDQADLDRLKSTPQKKRGRPSKKG